MGTKKEKPFWISLSYFVFEDRNYTRLSLILACLTVRARNEYNLARRNLPYLFTVMLSINGESNGKIRSTPMLLEILRTVKRFLPS